VQRQDSIEQPLDEMSRTISFALPQRQQFALLPLEQFGAACECSFKLGNATLGRVAVAAVIRHSLGPRSEVISITDYGPARQDSLGEGAIKITVSRGHPSLLSNVKIFVEVAMLNWSGLAGNADNNDDAGATAPGLPAITAAGGSAMPRHVAAILLAMTATVGCIHTDQYHAAGPHTPPAINVPPPGSVPRELEKITLPPYVIEPPDLLSVEVVTILEDPAAMGAKEYKAFSLPVQPVSGQFSVRPDGKVFLGIWGAVPVAGLTLDQAKEAIRDHISRQEDPTKPGSGGLKKETLRVLVDVLQYNSKRYYVITDGGGAGEQVAAFPVTGSETVFDAIANIGGLPTVSSKRNIWVARRTPHAGCPEQIMPVDWIGITQHGIAATNYQLMPGDRVYVKAQKLVTIDTALARFLSPIERVFGVTLLGANTVNQIQGRGFGFNN
jgi:polysaccharide biosynthesis/export protein